MSQQVAFTQGSVTTCVLLKYKVIIDSQGVLRWKQIYASPKVYSRKYCKEWYGQRRLPYISSPTDGKKVTATEATKLTGMFAPACLDYLMEQVQDHPDYPQLENYRKERVTRKKRAK